MRGATKQSPSSEQMKRQYHVYLMTNKLNTVLYTGVTNNLAGRVYEQQHGWGKFTSKHKICKLIYFELFDDPMDAISREKQIKGGSRKDKISLVIGTNKKWKDLSEEL